VLAGYTQLRLTREMVADQRCRRSGSDRSLGCHTMVEPVCHAQGLVGQV
jgi:hypothetical protein